MVVHRSAASTVNGPDVRDFLFAFIITTSLSAFF
jgi:hypothetical protein